MALEFKVPWEKYGIISYLAKVMEDFHVQFGKTSLQKIVYILQEVYGIKTDYSYTLYNYGPYSFDLASDLDYIAALKGVEVSWVNTGGYNIKPGDATNIFIDKSQSFISSNKTNIKKALDIFGRLHAKELELQATIIYFFKEFAGRDEQFISYQIRLLKPYFSEKRIRSAIDELRKSKVIN
jgi:uncharacterized protein YwgA